MRWYQLLGIVIIAFCISWSAGKMLQVESTRAETNFDSLLLENSQSKYYWQPADKKLLVVKGREKKLFMNGQLWHWKLSCWDLQGDVSPSKDDLVWLNLPYHPDTAPAKAQLRENAEGWRVYIKQETSWTARASYHPNPTWPVLDWPKTCA